MIVITRHLRSGTYTVTAPGMDARFFTSATQAETYAETRSLVLDLPVTRKVV